MQNEVVCAGGGIPAHRLRLPWAPPDTTDITGSEWALILKHTIAMACVALRQRLSVLVYASSPSCFSRSIAQITTAIATPQ